MNILPQILPELGLQQRMDLIACFLNNKEFQSYPGRSFGLDTGPAMEIVKPIIDSVLGEGTWKQNGGNFFETSVGYRIHADTGKDGPDNVLQTFVFPLSLTPNTIGITKPENVRLLILNQTWDGDAAFFVRGTPNVQSEYNIVVGNYRDVGNKDDGETIDGLLIDHCPHLNPSNFVGLSVDKNFQWIPGIPITFPRNRLHVSSAFTRQGYEKKLGLSIFTSGQGQ